MLEVEGLTVKYGAAPAVVDMSLGVSEGEIVGLVGPNGAGKSTTLNTIAGLLRPAEGSIRFEGESLVGLAPEQIVRTGLALVPEGRQIFGSLTVQENLAVGLSARRRTGSSDADIERVTELFPVLRRYYTSTADSLSGGEQQQLAIARSLLTDPRLLMLDEPSLGLAPQLVDLVFELLVDLRDRGVTILLVEQKALKTIELADRTYILRSGSLVFAGTREECRSRGQLIDDYLGARPPRQLPTTA
jgi:branched-chain amino acid transport system ATP-binding protein